MKKLSIKKKDTNIRFVLPYAAKERIFSDSFSGFITEEGNVAGACCNCESRSCIRYKAGEMHSEFFNSFTRNTTDRVCPTNAITFQNDIIHIDAAACIGCGICIHRCVYSAIAYDSANGKCFVQNSSTREASTSEAQSAQIQEIKALPIKVRINKISVPFLSNKASKIVANSDASEVIVRNFLINMGLHCNSYAKGNQHNRIEFFVKTSDKFIIGESETGSDTLSVSRRILDDLAVLVGRYSVPKENIIPLAVLINLPNKRTDFYEVLEDINNVIGIQIYTITYATLFLFNLFHISLNPLDFKSFLIDRKHTSLIPYIAQFLPAITSVCSYADTDYFSVKK